MTYRTIVLFILFGFTFNSFGQGQVAEADSILQIIDNTKEKDVRAEQFNALGNYYRYHNVDSAFKYINKARSLSEEKSFVTHLAESYNELGILWHKKSNIDSAFFYLGKAYNIALQNDDFRGMVKSQTSQGWYNYRSKNYKATSECYDKALSYVDKVEDKILLTMLYNNVAMFYKATAKVDLALEYYHKALALSEEQNNIKGIGLISSNLGLLYQDQGKPELALEYLNKSLKIRLKRGNRNGESYVLTNLGVVYEGLKDYDRSLNYYRKALQIKEELNSKAGRAILFNNIGIIHKMKGILDSALYYSNKSLVLRLEMKDKLGEARVRSNIGQVYILQSDYKKAEKELLAALQLASAYPNYSVLQHINRSLYEVNAKQGKYKASIPFLIDSYAFKDSVFNIQKEKSLANIEANYRNLKREKENESLQHSNRLKEAEVERQTLISFSLLAVLILFLILLYLVFRSRNKLSDKNKKIQQQTKELGKAYKELKQLSEFKEATTNMLIHDLKNPLNVIVNASSLKELDSFDELIEQSGYTMQNLVYNVLDVYKYQKTKLKITPDLVPLGRIIENAFKEVIYLAHSKRVELTYLKEMDFEVKADENILKRVFVNLFSNAIRFTPENKGFLVRAEIVRDMLKVFVENPGPGIPKGKQGLIFEYFKQAEHGIQDTIPSSGLGLAFCKMAIEAHGGEIGVESKPGGVEFWFTVPL